MIQLNWVAFISQTGTELFEICRACNIMPKSIVSNNIKKIKPEIKEFFEKSGVKVISIPFKPAVHDYINTGIEGFRLVTLHGYLRIIPETVLSQCMGSVFNGHPALITEYPELKGFNKQEDVFINKEKYPFIGSVIHEVTEKLDSGQVVVQARIPNVCKSIDDAYTLLRKTSLITWKSFFNEWIKIIQSVGAEHKIHYN